MSYEGFDQYLCANGHYRTFDAHDERELNSEFDLCSCGAMFIWVNQVDQTNGGNMGLIPPHKFPILVDAVMNVCEHCGHAETTQEARYKIPDNSLREYQSEEEVWEGRNL